MSFEPASLAQLFDPPEQYKGSSGGFADTRLMPASWRMPLSASPA